MNPESLRSQFSFMGISHDLNRREHIEEALFKEGFNVQLVENEESLVAKILVKPPHVVIVDLMGIEWKLKKLVEDVLKEAPETLFIFYGPADLFDRTRAYREFGLFQFAPDNMDGAYLSWICDMSISHLYDRYRNEELLQREPVSEPSSAPKAFPVAELIDANNTSGLFASFYQQLKAHDWKVLHLKYLPSKCLLVLAEAYGVDQEAGGIGIDLGAGKDLTSVLNRLDRDERLADFLSSVFQISDYVYQPLFTDKSIYGAVVCFGGSGDIAEGLRVFGKLFSKQSHLDRLAETSIYDPETGVLSNTHFDRCLDEEISRSRRLHLPVSLLHIGIDEIQRFRAEYGDETVEALVKAIAAAVEKTSRTNDFVTCLPGGAIHALLPHTHLRGAGIRAERLRRIVLQTRLVRNIADKVRLSIGVAEYPSVCSGADGLRTASLESHNLVAEQGGGKVCLTQPPRDFIADFTVDGDEGVEVG